nr:MAG TPA: hypothetical protein [Caudoviricetes sp.]
MYEVRTNKKEKMDITVISEDSVSIKTFGGARFDKDHGYTTLSYDGVCALINALTQAKQDMERNQTDFF